MSEPLPTTPGGFRAVLADPPWRFNTWNKTEVVQARASKTTYKSANAHYGTLPLDEIKILPVADVSASDCTLFIWTCWPMLMESLSLIETWGFKFKTCGFFWTKAHAGQIDMFREDMDALMGQGYWTRSNSEPCLLATRGSPKRLHADVRQGIIEPRREHSRKPDCVHGRIERLVEGPYLELFARRSRPGWATWGNEATKFDPIMSAAE